MKRRTFLLGLAFCTSVALFANDEPKKETNLYGVHPWKTPTYAGKQGSWSIAVEAGTTMFSGDISQSFKHLFPRGHWRPTLGLGVEYSINTTWGAALHYTYAPYYTVDHNRAGNELTGVMNSVELLATIDLMDIWFPKRPKNIFSFYLLAGGGYGFFNCEVTNPDGVTTYHGETLTSVGAKTTTNKDGAPYIPLGIAMEFNINRAFAIGVKGMYHLHMQDNLDSWYYSHQGTEKNTNNDFMEYATVTFRWKVPSRKADHKRNWHDPNPIPMTAAYQYGPQKAQPDTVVIVYKPETDTVYVTVRQEQAVAAAEPAPAANTLPKATPAASAYFDAGYNRLDDNALIALRSIALQMEEDTTLCLEISGYSDNTGDPAHNKRLSKKRAEIAKNELVSVYNIEPDRIITKGCGIIPEPRHAYKPNRRVDFRFITTEEADSIKNQKSDISFNEPRTYTNFAATEELQQDGTLSRLAKKHYGNAAFWVYIYEANQDIIDDPDRLQPGMDIRIPELPDEMIDASNPECMAYAKELRERYEK